MPEHPSPQTRRTGRKVVSRVSDEVLEILADMVRQHVWCDEKTGIYDSGCISTNKEALIVLVKRGVMVEDYPEKDYERDWTRWYYAHFPGEVPAKSSEASSPETSSGKKAGEV